MSNSPYPEDEFNQKLSTESYKLSFLQEYASTARPSGVMFSSSIKISNNSVIFENDEVYVPKEIDYQWLSDKLSCIGKIDSLCDYEDLIAGSNVENYHYINLTMQAIQEINHKLECYTKESFVTNSSKVVPSNSLRLSGSTTEFSRSEVIRTIELVAINSEVEQPERMLLLVYLIKFSVDTYDAEMFTEVVKFVFHLSELRRFNDTFLFTLDDIHYFGSKKNKEKHSEIQYLIELIDSKFFRDEVPSKIQLIYISILANLGQGVKQNLNSNRGKEGDVWCKPMLKQRLVDLLASTCDDQEESFVRRLPHDWNNDSINYATTAFISLVKL